MKKFSHSYKKIIFGAVSVLSLALYSVFSVSAAGMGPMGGYTPGSGTNGTLDPACAPGDTDCFVTTGWGLNTTDHYVFNTTDKIGLGTATPSAALDIEDSTGLLVNASNTVSHNLSSLSVGADFVLHHGDTSTGLYSELILGQGTTLLKANLGSGNSARFVWGSSDDWTSGDETKFFIDPATGSTRAGLVNDNSWDASNLGVASVAIGSAFTNVTLPTIGTLSSPAPLASGQLSIAIGSYAQATDMVGIAIGTAAHALGIDAVVVGPFSSLSVSGTIVGSGNTIDGNGSEILGSNALIQTTNSIIVGANDNIWQDSGSHFGNVILGNSINMTNSDYVVSVGSYNIVSDGATNAVALGSGLRIFGSEVAVGINNTAYTPGAGVSDRLFVIGNGPIGTPLTDDPTTYNHTGASDAFTILRNGNASFGISNWEADSDAGSVRLKVSGSGTVGKFVDGTDSCDIIPAMSGGVACSSDASLKKNVENLSSADTLAKILQLKPVLYNWRTQADGTQKLDGFIAQDVQRTFPNLVVTTSNGTLALSYVGLVPYTVSAIQELNLKLSDIDARASQIASNATFLSGMRAWLASAANGITDLYASILHSNESHTKKLCVGDGSSETCVTKADLDRLLQGQGIQAVQVTQAGGGSPSSVTADTSAGAGSASTGATDGTDASADATNPDTTVSDGSGAGTDDSSAASADSSQDGGDAATASGSSTSDASSQPSAPAADAGGTTSGSSAASSGSGATETTTSSSDSGSSSDGTSAPAAAPASADAPAE